MKKIMGVILISSLLLLVGTSSYAQASGVDTNSIDIFLQEKMREGGLPCLSLGIVKDGETLYYKTYGDKYSRNAGDSELIFPIGSISKTFTALAIRQLINRAELKENAPVNDYLPGFTTMYQGNEATVTIGQLIKHTSGISKLTGGAPYTYNTFYSLEKVVEKSMNITLAHSPGERYEYSNMNYILLGRILEIITGQSYSEYIREHIIEPLGMKNTIAGISQLQDRKYYHGYQPLYGAVTPVIYPFSTGNAPSGGVFSTAKDLCLWISLYQKGGYVNGISLIDNNPISPMGSEQICYDIYWVPMYKTQNLVINHNGSYPGYSSSMTMDITSGYGVVILANSFDQMGVFSQGPTPWSMTEEILTYLNTGKFPEQARTVWNYTPLAWMLFLLITVIILSIFVLVREVRRKRIMKNHWKLVRILIHFVIPAIWLILVPMVYESSWGWLIASNPIINISILLIMAAFVLTGIGRVVIMRCKSC